jgi:nucleotide-binding universal stress UspA family protein
MKRFKDVLFVADRRDALTTALDSAVALSQSNNARLTIMDVTPDASLAGLVMQA